jgi:hypothetical protein
MSTEGQPLKPLGKDPRELRYIAAYLLEIDPGEQREIDNKRRKRINDIAMAWDWNKVEALTVRETDAGTYKVVEGQGRALAAQLRDADAELPCFLIDVSRAQAAGVAREIAGTRTKHGAVDVWKLAIREGKPYETAAQNQLDRRMLSVGLSPTTNRIACVAVLDQIIKSQPNHIDGGEMLGRIIDVAMGAYPTGVSEDMKHRWNAHIIRALFLIFRSAKGTTFVDDTRLIRYLAARAPAQWIRYGQEATGNASIAIAMAVIAEYNKRKSAAEKLELT